MTCEACGNPLSGRQRRWCSATCRQRGHRAKPVRLPDSGSAAVRFLARFDGYEFEPAEAVALEQAAELAATVERLADIAEPSVAELRELRQTRTAVVKLVQSMNWPDGEAAELSDWGRAMARRRWQRSG